MSKMCIKEAYVSIMSVAVQIDAMSFLFVIQ